MALGKAGKVSGKLLVSGVNEQTQLRYAMDYYELMCLIIIATQLLIAVFPT